MAPTEQTSNLVSVIVPTYNYAHFLWQTLACVQMQTYGNWECVVVDDGSIDDTREVVQQFMRDDARIRYIHQQNGGLSAARNTGLRESRGQFIQLLDSDDFIEPRKLESQVAFLNTHPDIDIVCGEMRFVSVETGERETLERTSIMRCCFARQSFCIADNELVLLQHRDKRVSFEVNQNVASVRFIESDILLNLLRGNSIVVNTPLVRKQVFDDVGNFDQTLRSVEDWHFWIRCALQGKQFAAHHEPLTRALVRWHQASMSQNKTRMFRSMIEMRGVLKPLLGSAELKRVNRMMMVHDYAALGIHEGLEDQLWNGSRHLWKAAWLGKNTKWFVYGFALPLKKFSRLAPALSRIKARLFRND